MDGGSRHGSRGQGHSGPRGSAARGAGSRAAGSRNAGSPTTGSPAAGSRSAGSQFTGSGNGQNRPARPSVPLPDADRLTRLLEPVVHAMGMDLEGIKVTAAGRRRLLRVVVDADGGVSLDTIALASRELSARLDGASEMGELPYTLEVSSPGVDRPLTEPRHWRRAIGRLVVVPLTGQHGGKAGNGTVQPEGDRAEGAAAEGRVVSASDRGVTLDSDGELREFAYAQLGPGRVQVEFGHLEPDDDDLDEASADDASADDLRAEED
jgi:ribosome maturation factor RimP